MKIRPRPQVLRVALTVVAALGLLAASSHADPATDESEPDRFRVSLYGWLMGIHGTLKSPDGTINEFAVPFSQIFSRLEGVLQVTAEVDLAAWYFVFDGTWADLGGGYDGSLWALDVDVSQQIFDLKAGRSVFRRVEVDGGGDRRPWTWVSAVDVLLGARYFGTRSTITESALIGDETRVTNVESSRWDPVLGVRGALGLSRRWDLTFLGDLGGFGVGSAAEFTYQVDGNVRYRFGPALAAFVGYRLLSTTTGLTGGGDSTVRQQGPRVGVVAAF